jgi:uncharacterized OB-fold protein
MTATRPQPLADLATDVFWRKAQDHVIVYERCRRCGKVVFYPRGHCTACGSLDLDLAESAGRGEIYSFTVVRAHPEPYFAGRTPYVVAIIDLSEGIRLVAEVLAEPDDVLIGSKVTVQWDDSQPIPVPLFVIAAD